MNMKSVNAIVSITGGVNEARQTLSCEDHKFEGVAEALTSQVHEAQDKFELGSLGVLQQTLLVE